MYRMMSGKYIIYQILVKVIIITNLIYFFYMTY